MSRKHSRRRTVVMGCDPPAEAPVRVGNGALSTPRCSELVSERDAARIAGLSWPEWRSMREAGNVPRVAERLAGVFLPMWDKRELERWRDAGYPARNEWE
jgi:hypothetical protein